MTLVLFFGWILASWHKRIGKELEGAIAVAEPYGRIVAVLPSFGTASSDAIAAAGQGRLAPVFHVPVRSAHGAKAVFPPQHPCPRSDDAPLCEARCRLSPIESERATALSVIAKALVNRIGLRAFLC